MQPRVQRPWEQRVRSKKPPDGRLLRVHWQHVTRLGSTGGGCDSFGLQLRRITLGTYLVHTYLARHQLSHPKLALHVVKQFVIRQGCHLCHDCVDAQLASVEVGRMGRMGRRELSRLHRVGHIIVRLRLLDAYAKREILCLCLRPLLRPQRRRLLLEGRLGAHEECALLGCESPHPARTGPSTSWPHVRLRLWRLRKRPVAQRAIGAHQSAWLKAPPSQLSCDHS